jgi:16S rRNA (cytosine967-C5)-methyltransferase
VLRNKNFYQTSPKQGGGAPMRRLTLLGMADAVGLESLGGLSEEEVAWVDRIMEIDRKLMHQPFQHAEMAVRQAGRADGRRRNAGAGRRHEPPAPLDLRVNTLKANREDVIAKLAEAPIRQSRPRSRRWACAS